MPRSGHRHHSCHSIRHRSRPAEGRTGHRHAAHHKDNLSVPARQPAAPRSQSLRSDRHHHQMAANGTPARGGIHHSGGSAAIPALRQTHRRPLRALLRTLRTDGAVMPAATQVHGSLPRRHSRRGSARQRRSSRPPLRLPHCPRNSNNPQTHPYLTYLTPHSSLPTPH